MKAGIVGYRGAGKTTIFNVLTGLRAEVGGFHGDDVKNLGTIKVPDERLKAIADRISPKKLTYAEMAFTDLAATSPEKGKGFTANVLNELRKMEALVHVVRGFDNPALSEAPDLARDAAGFESELVLADLIVVEKRLERLRKEGTKSREREILEILQAHLEADQPLRLLKSLSGEDWKQLVGYAFLSQKPCLLLLNVPDDQAAAQPPEALASFAKEHDLRLMVVSGQVEMELNDLAPEEAKEYLSALGLSESARARFIHAAYDMLELISFFTAGPDEVRAWTIRRGTLAQAAAGKIHSDIERGFIRAEVMQWPDMVALGSDSKCREAGKMRLEGKEYLPQDGEVIHFRFNV